MKSSKDWIDTKLEDVCGFQNGFAFKSSLFRESGYPILRISNIQNDGVEARKLVFFDPKDYRENLDKYRVVEDDLLIAMSGATTGKLGFNTSNEVFYLNQRVGKFEPSERLNKWFLYYFLSTRIEENLRISAGAAQPNLSTEQIKGFILPLPPLTEQQRIVDILDEAFDGIATTKANAEKNIQNARDLFESYLQAIFTKRGMNWMEKLLIDVTDANCSLSYGIVQPGEEYPEGLPIVRPTDLTKKMIQIEGLKRIDPSLATSYRRTTLGGGELLLCVRGSTGMVSVASEELVGANVTRGIVPIRFNPSYITQEFGYYLFVSDIVQAQIRMKTYGAALMQINIRDLRGISLPFPSLQEQQFITKHLDALNAKTQRLESIYQQKLSALDELKKSLLHKAFAGEL